MATIQSQKGSSTDYISAPIQHAGTRIPGRVGQPTHDQIARRAYEIYVIHGRTEGLSEQNWMHAERQLADCVADASFTQSQLQTSAL